MLGPILDLSDSIYVFLVFNKQGMISIRVYRTLLFEVSCCTRVKCGTVSRNLQNDDILRNFEV